MSNVYVLATTATDIDYVPETLYLDSGCTNHVTNGSAFVKDLKKSSTRVCGPSGEIVGANHMGTIVFNVGKDIFEFKDALVVPALDRNLLSVKKITAAGMKVVFTENRFEIVKGDIHVLGTTIMQGQTDDTGLYALSPFLDESISSNSAEAEVLAVRQVKEKRETKEILNVPSKASLTPILPSVAPISTNTGDHKVTDQSLPQQLSKEPLSSPLASNDGSVHFLKDCDHKQVKDFSIQKSQ